MYNNEVVSELMECKHGKDYITLEGDKFYTKKVLNIWYPELSSDIIDKIQNGTYLTRQFGLNVNHCDNGSRNVVDAVTWWSGYFNKNCIGMSSDYYKGFKHLEIWNDHFNGIVDIPFFRDDSCIRFTKIGRGDTDVNKCKPVATISQRKPLVIVNTADGKLVTRDDTVADITYSEYTKFSDENGRILDCTDKGKNCQTCQSAMWDFQGEVPIYAGGCLLS
ncbi:hypothetical protein [Wolbachia endosymbiont of Ctenocephalides felis wCfeT]|uniref:hypothetical protein n=1 Tax=Wolbachia endosymbiont of Ctenocephalides felis wCfeT TaxID=2732593 RepID=UPI0014450C11|nr:hypothetical protein [Wolbachia endosymbiont of Ctenocephalides felis wCfeT]